MSVKPRANDPSDSAKLGPVANETVAFGPRSMTGTPSGSPAPAPELPAPAKSLTGQCFDDIELLEEIGRGGMGVVFKARQKSLDRLVGVKILLAEHYVDPIRLARFQGEARAAASLTHNNIIQIYQVGECPFGPYFVMEYVDGRTLESVIEKGNIQVPAALALTMVVAQAVHYAHTKGIVHRDLKPANIMIDRSRRPVVMDFGIAKLVGKSSLTQEGVIMGTPAFMAPEQAGDALDQVGAHSDVYALGAILYAMLAGRPPFEEDTPLRTVLKVIGPDLPPSLRQFRPNLSEAVEQVCMKCLNKKPADRYASAMALADDLRRLRGGGRPGGDATVAKKRSGVTMTAELPTVLLLAVNSDKTFKLAGPKVVIGRTSECDVPVRAADVSKQHCQILIDGNRVEVEDLNSANGTYINGRSIQRTVLRDKDRLRVAEHEFIVRLPHGAK